MTAILKRIAEVLAACGIVYGAFVAIVLAFDGHVPPWYSIAQAQTLEQSLKSFEAEQNRRDKSTQSNIDLLVLGRLRDEAKAANEKAELHPHDAAAKADAWFSQKKLEVFFRTHPALAEAMEK